LTTKILFVCVQNSARSQIAEALANQLCGPDVHAYSAGIEPGSLNPLAVEVMQESGVDISLRQTKSVFDIYRAGMLFNYVVTVCDEASAERCPVFPGITKRLHWSFPDPAAFEGSHDEKLAQARVVRDQIKAKVEELCRLIRP
jgi:arsenate reductase (thioredoxin)